MKKKTCKGDIVMHNDGRDFLCMGCGKLFHRSRDCPLPDTTHSSIKQIRQVQH